MIYLKVIGVVFFIINLFTIWKIYKADIYQKWWKYLLPLFVNFPTFIFTNENGFNWKFLYFYFLGTSIDLGLRDKFAIAAIPIGSLYVWWKLSRWKMDKEYDQMENMY